MLTTISGDEIAQHEQLMLEAFRFRHAVFVEEKGWEDLRRSDGLEIDGFDDAHTVHQICRRAGVIVGYQRLRPTLQSHLLANVLRDLCREEPPCAPHIYEWSRFAIGGPAREARPRRNEVFLELTEGVVDWCLERGVSATTVVIDLRLMVIAMQLRFDVRPLGFPRKIGREEVVALRLNFDAETLRTIREVREQFAAGALMKAMEHV